MTKIMLVEDDKSLREIYGVRLLAEGYDIVSAGDGEEALAIAIKERPTLIISDVMMPKISGFDMLDILRSTTETRNVKVIMMTALSSDDQRTRGEQLGADRYLVKSQVGIEDVVRVVHEVLGDGGGGSASQPQQPQIPQPQAPPPQPPTAPAAPVQQPQQNYGYPMPQQAPAPAPPQYQQPQPQPQQVQPQAAPQQPAPAQPPAPQPQPQAAPPPQPPRSSTPAPIPTTRQSASNEPASTRNRTIQPLNDPHTNPVNLNDLLDKELARETDTGADGSQPSVASTDEERSLVNNQINEFANQSNSTNEQPPSSPDPQPSPDSPPRPPVAL